MKIIIETIPHDQQPYSTCGDWRYDDDGTLRIKVSDMGNDDYAWLVALHELVEVKLCSKRGITTEAVDAFDKDFEAKRPEGNEDEPGDAPDAPYKKEHFFATSVERLAAAELGVDWSEYDKTIASLP